LVIDRADGRGLSFPGGIALPWEKAEETMRREVLEKTGLQIEKASLLFEYPSSADTPCRLAVFEGAATGKITESWEGLPRWLPWTEIRTLLLPSQREIVDRLS